MKKIDIAFLLEACDAIADTNEGLSTADVVKYSRAYSMEYNVEIPYCQTPLPQSVPNKRTALFENLNKFSSEQQYSIINNLCKIPKIQTNERIKKISTLLLSRYGDNVTLNNAVVEEAKHWLSNYPESLNLYKTCLEKFQQAKYQRNCLDDIRLALELLLKSIFANDKSLENQVSNIGGFVKRHNGSPEFSNMFRLLIDYFTKYENHYVKHDDNVIEEEIEFIIELASSFMKHLVKLNSEN